ncbi:permease prefix domain 1-containing protein [Agromyces sp. NPDC057865]|uniref:permease prefix domain 1-containing protein n=1 Tax=Agromyces sp. NPDC057865 TaxID=3346267 RepID=UPI00366B3D70
MTTEPFHRAAGGSVHRLLDEAFAGVKMTPDLQDLKEEIRANLAVRADELMVDGRSPEQAARQAFDELGDLGALIAETQGVDAPETGARSRLAEHLARRVRPRPAFVVRTVLLCLVALAGLVVLVLDGFGVLTASLGLLVAAVAAVALPLGWVTADALRQETTSSFPLPVRRAVGFGVGVGLILAGLGVGWLVVQGVAVAWLVLAAAAVVGGIALLSYLGATKTNRHKPWVLAQSADFEDRFSSDPAAAARFGIYTAVLWTAAFALFIVLSFTVGWAWSWLALVVGFLVMLVILARMLFPLKG